MATDTRLNPFGGDRGSRLVSVRSILAISLAPSAMGMPEFSIVFRTKTDEQGFERIVLPAGGLHELEALFRKALTDRPNILDTSSWQRRQETLARDRSAKEAFSAQVMAQQEAERLRLAAVEARELAPHRSQLESGTVFMDTLTSGTSAARLDALYGRRPTEDKGQRTEYRDSWGVTYLSGLPALDDAVHATATRENWPIERVPHSVAFFDRGFGLEVRLANMLWGDRAHVHWPHAAVRHIEIRADVQEALTSAGNVVAPAILGGLLLGPVGAIVGGVSGAAARNEIRGSGLLKVDLRTLDGGHSCHFLVASSRHRSIAHFMRTIYGDRVRVSSALDAPQDGKSEEGPLSNELERLADLWQRGVLTSEEFDAAKKRLLGLRG